MTDITSRRVLAVFAHPDDEAFGVGGTLAALAAGGAAVRLVCATRGEVGEISDPALATHDTLPQVRAQELACACSVLGIEPPELLDYRDSGMQGTLDNDHPDSLARADLGEVAGRIVRHIREWKPDVIFTFDATGGYGHPDHIAVHHATTMAFEYAADPSCYPDQGSEPHAARKLLYTAMPRTLLTTMVDRMQAAGGDMGPFAGLDMSLLGVPDDQVHLAVDVSAVLPVKLRAMRCHATQIPAEGGFGNMSEGDLSAFMSREYFVQARPAPSGRARGDAASVVFGRD